MDAARRQRRAVTDAAKYLAEEDRFWAAVGARPDQIRVHLNRSDVTVRLQSLGDGPPILFVPGAMTGGACFGSLAVRVRDRGYRCLLLDRPGTVLSDPYPSIPTFESAPVLAEALVVDVLDALGIQTAHLVGSSLGGYPVLRTAAAHPDRVGRIMLFSLPVGAAMVRVPFRQRIMALPGLSRITVVPANERIIRLLFRQIGQGHSVKAGNITQADIDGWLAMLRYTDTRRNDMAVGRAFFSTRGLRKLALPTEVLAKIEAPTYFFWGENDPAGGAEVARHLAGLIPHAELELVPGTGHAPWFDHLDRVAETMDRFFGG